MIELLRQKAKACGCSEKYPKRILQLANQRSSSAVSHVPLKFSLEREVSQQPDCFLERLQVRAMQCFDGYRARRPAPVSALKIGMQGQGRFLGLRKRKLMYARYIPVSACFAGCRGQECESNEMHCQIQ